MACDNFIKRGFEQGVNYLNDIELLALILRSNNAADAYEKASKIIAKNNEDGGTLASLLQKPAETLRTCYNLNFAEACALAAVKELSRRAIYETMRKTAAVDTPNAVGEYLTLTLRAEPRELFMALYVNTKLHLIRSEILFSGTLNQTAVYPRQILRRCIEVNAAGVILAHNHPSGNPVPSPADKALTRSVQSLLEHADISVLDHLIVAGDQVFSFIKHGLM